MTEKKKRLVKFIGKCLYAQVYPGQERAAHPEAIKKDPHIAEDKHYQITVECSKSLYEKLLYAGISRMTILKEFEGDTYLTIKGSKQRKDKNTNQMYIFPDPIVLDIDDLPMAPDILIGNGSYVEVIAELADVNHFKALRLHKVKVLNLIPYVRSEIEGEIEFEEEQKEGDRKEHNKNKEEKNLF